MIASAKDQNRFEPEQKIAAERADKEQALADKEQALAGKEYERAEKEKALAKASEEHVEKEQALAKAEALAAELAALKARHNRG